MIPEKIEVSRAEKEYHQNWCARCDKYYCSNCVEFCEVTFDIEENVNDGRPDLKPNLHNWKGESVCIWCFNQLIDEANHNER